MIGEAFSTNCGDIGDRNGGGGKMIGGTRVRLCRKALVMR